MKLVTFMRGGKERVGAILANGDYLDLDAAVGRLVDNSAPFGSMIGLIESGERGLEIARQAVESVPEEAVVAAKDVRLLAPIPKPPRLRDTLMFLEHLENGLRKWAQNQANMQPDPTAALAELMKSGRYSLHPVFKERVIYYKSDHLSVSGPGAEIVWPDVSDYPDFELEWAIVIGHSRRSITVGAARDAIFGYTIYNDWSARDIQLNFMQANLGPAEGKDFALSNTIGPCIVTKDEIKDPYSLKMEARVNGEVWSRGTTGSMYHPFEKAIAQFSRFEDLAPGEIIGSGTVLNGCGFELGRRLKDADVVELEVEGIGTLRNRVKIN
jgi:2-keto-4-pentenoate hydratase/2-oxohepta-3-ene-1,7-dioic acid hydratase in catechol pathway